MKFSTAILSLAVLLPLLVADSVAAGPTARAFGQGGNGKFGGNKGGNKGAANNGAANNAAKGNAGNTGAKNNAGNNGGNAAANGNGATGTAAAGGNGGGDPQKSTTLDPKVIATGFALDGQQTPAAGQVASLTSTNNYINFCLTVPNLPITNGLQVKTGSCNPAPMGVIAATTNIPSSKFSSPKNLDTIEANKNFTITMNLQNLQAGNFVNAAANYYSAPQTVNQQGNIIGHTHFVIEALQSLTQTTVTDPTTFAFFKGVNTAQQNGAVSVEVAGGLPAGVYRLACINSSANHQPALVAVAQHGHMDDMIYFTVADGAGAAAGGAGAGAGAGKGGNNAAAGAAKGGNNAAAGNNAAKGGNAAAKGGNAAKGGKGQGRKGRRGFSGISRESS